MEELNQWLADPILRAEVMARVMRNERYTLEFDDCGETMRVMEVERSFFEVSVAERKGVV